MVLITLGLWELLVWLLVFLRISNYFPIPYIKETFFKNLNRLF